MLKYKYKIIFGVGIFMKNRITKVDYIFSMIILFVSCLGLAIFIEHLLGYQYQEWFYENGIYDPYTNVNVVSRWADFSFFTYISLIIFCLWGIVRFISIVFRLERLYKIVNNSYLILFICLNQFNVCLLYTISQVAFKGTFGWWDNSPRSLHSLGTNIAVHYFITAIGIVYFLIHNFEKVKFKKCLLFLIFFTIYGIIVKIAGMHCYVFEWYPYPIFTKDALARIIWKL